MSTAAPGTTPATAGDIRQLFGDIEDDVVMDVLELNPTVGELEETAAWLAGQGDVVARAGHPQSAKIAAILDLLGADEDVDERRPP
jgi:hypothetical protein